MQHRDRINRQRPGTPNPTSVSSLTGFLVGSLFGPMVMVMMMMVAGLALASCSSGGGGEISEPSGTVDSITDSVDPGPDFVPTETDSAGGSDATNPDVGAPTTEFDLDAQPSVPPIDPIPETGVPGIDSSDAFCRAWSEFAGSFQALGLTSAVGDAANAVRLEVIAASSVTSAVETMEANLPAELESERSALIDDFAGPFFARAVVAEAALVGAGVDPDLLRDTWIATLTEAGVDDPMIEVQLAADIDGAALDAAVVSFADAQPPIVEDPTLITDASIPETETYLADVCPDGGILSGNDVTGS